MNEIKPPVMNLVKTFYPSVVSHDIEGVQPMDISESGATFRIRYVKSTRWSRFITRLKTFLGLVVICEGCFGNHEHELPFKYLFMKKPKYVGHYYVIGIKRK